MAENPQRTDGVQTGNPDGEQSLLERIDQKGQRTEEAADRGEAAVQAVAQRVHYDGGTDGDALLYATDGAGNVAWHVRLDAGFVPAGMDQSVQERFAAIEAALGSGSEGSAPRVGVVEDEAGHLAYWYTPTGQVLAYIDASGTMHEPGGTDSYHVRSQQASDRLREIEEHQRQHHDYAADSDEVVFTEEVVFADGSATASPENNLNRTYEHVFGPSVFVADDGTVILTAAALDSKDFAYGDFAFRRRRPGADGFSEVYFPLGQLEGKVANSFAISQGEDGRLWGHFRTTDGRQHDEVYRVYSDDLSLTWRHPETDEVVTDPLDAQEITSQINTSRLADAGETFSLFAPAYTSIRKRLPPHRGRIIQPFQARLAGGRNTSFVLYSDDNGATWETSRSLGFYPSEYKHDSAGQGPGPGEASPYEIGDGSVRMQVRMNRAHAPVKGVSKSPDGESWTWPQLDHNLIDGGEHAHTNGVVLSGLLGGEPRMVTARLTTLGRERTDESNGVELLLSADWGERYSHVREIWSGPTGNVFAARLNNHTALVLYERGLSRFEYRDEIVLTTVSAEWLKGG